MPSGPSHSPCNLQTIAERLVQQSRASGLLAKDIVAVCPGIARQIAQDAQTPGLMDLWGLSRNVDELAGTIIVDPGILAALGELAGLPLISPVVHAGLQHTYGYLFSTIETPYGSKRDRWTNPWLEQGFGLPTDVLGPEPLHGTLLGNATRLSCRIAFRDNPEAAARLAAVFTAASVVDTIPISGLDQIRITESVVVRDGNGRFQSVRIVTDLVRFPYAVPACPDSSLLVYSVETSGDPAGGRLITLFPVGPGMVEELTHPDRFGLRQEIRPRFNAVVPGMDGPRSGRRVCTVFTADQN